MVDTLRKEIVELMQELIQNKCVNPPGDEMKNISTLEKYLDSYGIKTEVFESGPNRGNLFAEIPGKGDRPSLMFGPSHVDVVPVEDESRWKVPPFEGRVQADSIWGRGSTDMLFIVASQAVVFAHLFKDGFKPKGTLKLLFVADEEAGGNYGAGWMVKNHPDKVKVDYLVTEAGGFHIAPQKVVFTSGEKGATWLRLHFEGEEQHGSMPFGAENAIVSMSKGVDRIVKYKPPIDTTLVQDLLRDMGINIVFRTIASQKLLFPLLLRVLSNRNPGMAKFLHALSRMTMSPNLTTGGTKVNVIPGLATLDVDIRTLPGQDEEYVQKHIKKALGPLALDVEIHNVAEKEGGISSFGNASDPKSELVNVMKEVTEEITNEKVNFIPIVMPGATDCRFFRETFGTQAYGYSLIDDSLDMQTLLKMAHGDNERVPLSTIKLTSKAYMELAKRFLT